MKNTSQDWKPIIKDFSEEINSALQQQHHAAQFIALAGHYLIKQQTDDSNTNMKFVADEKMLQGRELGQGLSLGLNLETLKIHVLQNTKIIESIDLNGRTKQQVFGNIKEYLSDLGVEVSDFKNQLHYQLHSHQLDSDDVFSVIDDESFVANTNYRHNADLVIGEIVSEISAADLVRIWPHHFDTGSFIPVSKNEKGDLSKSIGFGWAMPDSMVDEPYYYLSFWLEEPLSKSANFNALEAGDWKMPDWNGAVLKHSEIKKQKNGEAQFETVKSFFINGIESLMNTLTK